MPIASAFRSALLVFGLALTAFVSPALLAQGSTAADGFNPNVNGNVYALALQPDGKMLLAGSFSTVQPNGADQPTTHNNIARVLPDGRDDSSFAPDVNGQINAMVLQPDGKIVIGGKFSAVGGTARIRIARLNADGTLDATFSPSIDPNNTSLTPEVMALALQADGKIVVGGGFMAVQGGGATSPTVRNRIARLNADGTLDDAFNPDANGMVLSLAVQPDQEILVGGGFTTIQGVGRNRIARLSSTGTVDGFDPSANNAVSAIEVLPSGRILIGGSFTTLQPNSADQAVTTGVLRIAQLDPNGALTTKDGTTTSDFTGNIDGPVAVIKRQSDGLILVGGSFATVGGNGRAYLARIYPSGSADLTFAPTPNSNVSALLIQPNGSIVLGGYFNTLRGSGQTSVVRNHMARISPSGLLDADFRPDVNGRLRSLMVQSDRKIIAGGSFTSIAGQTRSGIARLNENGSVDPSFKAEVNGGVVAAVQQSDKKIIIAGAFTRVNSVSRAYLARLNEDGSLDETYDPAPNNQVNALLLQSDGRLLIGGAFTALSPLSIADPVARNYLARINTDGSLDLTYTAQTSDAVWALVAQSDNKVLVGGSFSSVLPAGETTAVTRNRIMRLDADGKLDTVFNPNVNGLVDTIAVQSDGKVIFGGGFLQLAPNGATTATTRNHIARVAADGSLDTAFDPNLDGVVTAIAVQTDGKIVVGGTFSSVKPAPTGTGYSRSYLARLESTGALDDSFNLYLDVLPGNEVTAVVLTGTKILIGGAFTQVGADRLPRSRIAQVDATGLPDTSFNADLASGGGAPISAITTQYNGEILAAGTFATINGTGSANLARFSADGVPDLNFVPTINGPVYSIAEAPIKGTAVPTQSSGFAWLEPNGQLRSTFKVDSAVTSMTGVTAAAVQTVGSDTKLLLAGTFNVTDATGAPVAPSLVRFNPDGTVDTSFALKTTGTINVIKVLSDGRILIGGTFATIGDATRNNIARLDANGNLDTGFSVATDGAVYAIAFQSDGKMLLSGAFTSIAGSGSTTYTARSYIARINTDLSVDTTFDPKANGSIPAMVIQAADGKIVIGGNFTTLQPNSATTATARNYIARLNTDGTLDQSIDLAANGSVAAFGVQSDNKIVVGGYFTSIGGSSRHYLVRLNADLSLDDFNPNPNSSVFALTVDENGKILIGGSFTALQPNSSNYDPALATPRNRAARLNPDGTVDASFNPSFDSAVGTLVSYPDGSVLASGSFTAIQPTGALLVGGAFSAINGVAVNNLALIGGDGSVSSAFLPNPDGAVYAIVQLADGRSVISGSFTNVGPDSSKVQRNHIARYTAANELDTSFNPNIDGDVFVIALQDDGKLIVGGGFSKIAGAARPYLARLNTDGSVDGSFNASVAGIVHSVVLQPDGRILYTAVPGTDTSVNNLGRLNADGSVDGSFNPGNDGQVNSIAVQADGKITVGGSFQQIGGTQHPYLARLNADGSLDASVTSKPSGPITALALQRDGKIVIGGLFNAVDDLPRYGLARVSTSASSSDSFSINAERNTVIWTRTGAAPEVSGVVFETSADTYTWANVGAGTRISGTSNWRISGLSLASDTMYIRASGIMPASPNSSSGLIESRGYVTPSVVTVPVITSATAVSAASGSSFLYAISASGSPTAYGATALPAGLTLNTTTGVISGTPTQTGTFTVVLTATNGYGSSSTNLTLFVGAPGSTTNVGRLINLSVNVDINASNPTIIAGFVISGNSSQNVLLRAVGPSLTSLGVTNALAKPTLKLFKGQVQQNENSGWGGGSELVDTFARLGAFPLAAGSADAALLVTLAPGAYTIVVSDLGTAGGTVLAEVYDAQANPPPADSPHLINLSARGVVSAGQFITGGFVITGSTAKQVLIRGIGPGLTAQNVTGALANPAITLNQITGGTATVIARNDDWSTPVSVSNAYPAASATEISAAATATGAFALTAGSADSAILITLAPGVYTAQVGGADSGAAMVEVYEVK